MQMRELECFGGPLCGSMVRDTKELWMAIASVRDPKDQHFYKRVKMVDYVRGKSLLIWHYHGKDPGKQGVPMIRPSHRKFR